MNELKKCPFCGGEAVEDSTVCSEYYGHEHQDMFIECSICGAEVWCGTGGGENDDFPCSCCHDIRTAVRTKWNRRANSE